ACTAQLLRPPPPPPSHGARLARCKPRRAVGPAVYVPAVKKNGEPDLALRRLGFVSIVHPKPERPPPRKKARKDSSRRPKSKSNTIPTPAAYAAASAAAAAAPASATGGLLASVFAGTGGNKQA